MPDFTTNAAQRWKALKRVDHRRSIRHVGRSEPVRVNLRGRTWQGFLVNISHEGMAVVLPEIVTSGARVEFACESLHLAGTGIVRYSRERDGRYLVGVQFQPGTEWTPGAVTREATGEFWKWDWDTQS